MEGLFIIGYGLAGGFGGIKPRVTGSNPVKRANKIPQ